MSTTEREREVTVVPSILDPRVEKGARLLDERMPGWADKIDLDAFRFEEVERCVLGQVGLCYLSGGYGGAVASLFGADVWTGWGGSEQELEHGFWPSNRDDAMPLEQDWTLAILARQT